MNDLLVVLVGVAVGYAIGQIIPIRLVAQEAPVRKLSVPRPNFAVLIVSIFVLLFAGFFYQDYRGDQAGDDRQRELTSCIADWAIAYSEASNARTVANTEKDAARDAFLLSAGVLLTPMQEPTQDQLLTARDSFVAYQAATEVLDKARQENPYPEFPLEGCGRE